MNVGRFLASAAAVWLVRVALNWTFYTRVIGHQSQQIAAAHPGIFREVVPGLILTDLVFALVFTYLFAEVGAALGGGPMAGVKLGLLVAVLSPVIGNLYQHFSVTYLSVGLMTAESVFQLIAHAIEGAVAGAMYRTEGASKMEAVRPR
jgi:hypothetical protein